MNKISRRCCSDDQLAQLLSPLLLTAGLLRDNDDILEQLHSQPGFTIQLAYCCEYTLLALAPSEKYPQVILVIFSFSHKEISKSTVQQLSVYKTIKKEYL